MTNSNRSSTSPSRSRQRKEGSRSLVVDARKHSDTSMRKERSSSAKTRSVQRYEDHVSTATPHHCIRAVPCRHSLRTFIVFFQELLLALFVRPCDDELVVALRRSAPNRCYSILVAVGAGQRSIGKCQYAKAVSLRYARPIAAHMHSRDPLMLPGRTR